MYFSVFPGTNALLEKMATNRGPDTPLHEAAYKGDFDQLTFLLDQPEWKRQVNAKNWLGCTPLRLAATGQYQELAGMYMYTTQTGCYRLVSRTGWDVNSDWLLQVSIKTWLGCTSLRLAATG